MKDEKDPRKRIDRLIEALGFDNPQTDEEYRRELSSAGLDAESVRRELKRDVEAGIADIKREEFLEKAKTWLSEFFHMIFSTDYLQPARAAVVRSGDLAAEENGDLPDTESRYTEAVTLMRKGDFNGARTILETLLAQDDEENLDKYRFTLAHVLLAQNDPSGALQHLGVAGGEFKAKALELIEQIEDLT